MSLVNDALKRAKEAQKENPPPTPPLEFRPVQPAQEGRPNSPVFFIGAVLGLVVMVGLGGLLLWGVTQQRNQSLQVEAKGAPVETPVKVEPPPASTPEEAMTNTLPAAVVEPPMPEFKLQGIFYNPRSPSAVVNGRTVYVGDKVEGFQVYVITPAKVTLGNATRTNVLSLSQ